MLFEEQLTDAQVLGRMMGRMERDEVTEAEAVRWLDDRFGRTASIMIIDMCGFTRSTRDKGIVEFLRRMYEVQKVIVPIIDDCAGSVLNTIADSLAVLFPSVDHSILAAGEMFKALDLHNATFPAAPNHYISVGIGYGRLLVIGRHDAFGNEMNHAGKLGEDIAGQREVLLTPKAMEAAGDDIPVIPVVHEIAGAKLTCGRLDVEHFDADAIRDRRRASARADTRHAEETGLLAPDED